MRILSVMHYWLPHRGGIETVGFEHMRLLAARGHQIVVVASSHPATPAITREHGYIVRRVPAMNLLERRGIPYPVYSPSLWSTLRRLIAHSDVVILNNHTYLGSVLGVAAAAQSSKPALAI